jgi:uncharacterized phage protein gp47/JayE
MSTYGVTETGFAIKSLQILKNEIEKDFQDMFGTNIDISTNSPEGQIIGNLSIKLAYVWELLLAIVSMFNPNSAEGTALDAACAGNGISRKASTAAIVPVLHYGVASTNIPLGNHVRDINLHEYSLLAATTISLISVADAYVSCPSPAGGIDYSITLNGVTITYTSSPGDSAFVIYENLRNLINNTPNIMNIIIAFIDLDTSLLRIQSIDGGFTSFILAVNGVLTITNFGTPGQYACTEVGFFQPLVDSITTMVTTITGLVSVDNITGGNAGTDEETDEQLRVRRLVELVAKSGSSDIAIAATLPSLVTNVSYCTCKSNRTDITDIDSRPPHSLEVTVEGGDPLLIAQAIWQLAPSGIAFYGNTSQAIVDSNGDTQTILFTRPVPVYIWINIEATHSTKISIPVNAIQAIQTNIMNWAASNSAANGDVLIQELFAPIYQCLGIAVVTLLEIGSSASASVPPVSYGTTNITIGIRQLPVFDPARISVVIS